MLFFFSSRRRHTRCSRDWSSDVCSSDLGGGRARAGPGPDAASRPEATAPPTIPAMAYDEELAERVRALVADVPEIGRASCRERGRIWVAAGLSAIEVADMRSWTGILRIS